MNQNNGIMEKIISGLKVVVAIVSNCMAELSKELARIFNRKFCKNAGKSLLAALIASVIILIFKYNIRYGIWSVAMCVISFLGWQFAAEKDEDISAVGRVARFFFVAILFAGVLFCCYWFGRLVILIGLIEQKEIMYFEIYILCGILPFLLTVSLGLMLFVVDDIDYMDGLKRKKWKTLAEYRRVTLRRWAIAAIFIATVYAVVHFVYPYV